MIKEIKKDLLQMDASYPFAHCISSDWAMGAGIAKTLENKYHIKRKTPKEWMGKYPSVSEIDVGERHIYNLVTKEKYYHKPTLSNLKKTIINLKQLMEIGGIKKVAMPKIGCGLDRLQWGDVKQILEEVFDDTYEIIVCYL